VRSRSIEHGCEYKLDGDRQVVLTITPAAARRRTRLPPTPDARPSPAGREVHAIEGVKDGSHVEIGVYGNGPEADKLAKALLSRVLTKI
jgi:hypothetical protein